ncbi:MAG: N-acetyl sugar amidotransferase [Candidatus Electrothrix scaldis]|nr:MAG: N-acetyl sugar amidotransferase [Candidatus Electrothrix sp. GW3-3]
MWSQRVYQQCTYCVMDTTDPEIVFDEKGQCHHCRSYQQKVHKLTYQGKASDHDFKLLTEQVKIDGKTASYDCVIGVSGGVDSSYTCYLAKRLGLRPLAVHMDNGWNSREAVKNIKTICNSLEIDYVSHVLNWEEFKDLQLAFLKASIVEMEIPTDVAIQYALHKVAAENGVKYILSGGNMAGEAILPRTWFYYPKDSKLLKSIHRKYGTKKISTYPTFDYLDEIYYKFIKGIRILYPLNYVPYSKPDAMKTLEEKLGWVKYGGVHHESMFTRIVLSYLQPTKFQVDYRKCTLSAQICNGIISRKEALAQLENLSYDPDKIQEEKAYVAKKFGLSLAEFEKILSLPPKSYRDYPNNEKLLDFLYSTYRRFWGDERSYHNAGYDSSS